VVNEDALAEYLDALSKDVQLSGSGRAPTPTPWELAARDYLGFAQSDFMEGGARGRVNALGNAKRALHCQVDSILYGLAVYPTARAQRWAFPARLDFVADAGIVAPNTLRRLNKARNEVEHEYAAPRGSEELEAYIDLVELFIAATRAYTVMSVDWLEFVIRGHPLVQGLSISFAPATGTVAVGGADLPTRHPLVLDLIKSAVALYEKHDG
jgi:hypothetical protein